MDSLHAVREQSAREVAHWALAVSRLQLDDLASPQAWGRLERYLGVSLRRHLAGLLARLEQDGNALVAMQRAARTPLAISEVRRKLLAFRQLFLSTETTLDFFADAINGRTNPRISALLRACDTLAQRSMSQLLDQLGRTTPPSLTYVDKGLGASILRAGLRLWDGGDVCPVAAIKIVRHNLLRPTSFDSRSRAPGRSHMRVERRTCDHPLLRTRRQVDRACKHLGELVLGDCSGCICICAYRLRQRSRAPRRPRRGPPRRLPIHPGDPHPVSFIRVLLGVEMCRYFYGDGRPWDDLELSWIALHPVRNADGDTRTLLENSRPILKDIVRLTLDTPMRAFKARPLRALIQPERVSPAALSELNERIGPALFTSAHWLWTEPLRILALTGLQVASRPENLTDLLKLQEESMLRVGGALQAA